MTEWGLAKVEAAKRNGMWEKPDRPQIPPEIPGELEAAFAREGEARRFFETLAPSHKRRFIGWIASAKRPETRAKRAEKSVRMLKEKKKLGLV